MTKNFKLCENLDKEHVNILLHLLKTIKSYLNLKTKEDFQKLFMPYNKTKAHLLSAYSVSGTAPVFNIY